jgi:hypothetical protein
MPAPKAAIGTDTLEIRAQWIRRCAEKVSAADVRQPLNVTMRTSRRPALRAAIRRA